MQHAERTPQPSCGRTFSPVHSARKLAHVLGTTSARSSITKRPAGVPPMDTSKNTFGRAMTPLWRTTCSAAPEAYALLVQRVRRGNVWCVRILLRRRPPAAHAVSPLSQLSPVARCMGCPASAALQLLRRRRTATAASATASRLPGQRPTAAGLRADAHVSAAQRARVRSSNAPARKSTYRPALLSTSFTSRHV